MIERLLRRGGFIWEVRRTLDESYACCRGEDQDKEPNKECLPPYHGWLEFFVGGLAQQLEEVKARGTMAIRRDILVRQHRLNERQGRAIEYLLESATLDLRTFQALCSSDARRTLQRDLSQPEAKGLVTREGETNNLTYRLRGGM